MERITDNKLIFVYPMDQSRQYNLDYIFTEEHTPDDLFAITAKPLLNHLLRGNNAVYFAYGQSATGELQLIPM